MAEGARRPGPNWPSGSSGCPNGRGQVHRLHPMQTATAMRSQRQKWGSKSSLSQGLGLASGWPCEGSRALQDGASSLFPGPSNLPTALRLGELQVPREKARICLYLNLHLHGGRTTTHSMDHLLNAPLEKGKATYSSILAWTIQSMGSQRIRHN